MATFNLEDINDPYMPFGKFGPKGEMGHSRLSELPDDYILWLLEKAESDMLTPDWLNGAVKDEWRKRKK